MSKEQKVLWGVGIVVAIALLAWFGVTRQQQPAPEQAQAPETPVSSEPIKVGFISPLTGDAAVYGEPGQKITQLAVDEINAAGGVGGRPLTVIYEDGKCNGKDAANAMQKLVTVDKVKVVIGGFCSSESLAAVPIAEQNKVALFSPGSSSPDLTGKSPFFARNYPSDASQGQVLADVAVKRGWKKVAFIQEQLDYPLGVYKAFSAQFEKNGGTLVKEEFATTTTDFRSSLLKLRGEKPDALFIDTQTPAASERVLKQVKEAKWEVPLLFADILPGDKATVEANTRALEGALAAEFGSDPENPKMAALLAAYKERYGADMPYQSYGQTEYDAVYLVRDALAAVGEDGEKIAQWLRSTIGWEGASGAITIGSDGDRAGGHTPKVIKGGKVEILTE